MWSSVKRLTVIASLLVIADAARAADLALPAAAPPAASYSWSGLYLGLNAGYAGASLTETAAGGGSGSASIPGAVGGFQVGANYQIGAVVLGFEADFDAAAATRSINIGGGFAANTAQIPWLATLRGRAGLALDRWLLYVTAGGIGTQLRSTVNVTGVGSSSTTFTHSGWTAGGGLEAAITGDLSARLEYLYLDTGNFTVAEVGGPPPFTVSGRLRDSLVRAGLNYRLPVAW